MLESLAHKHDGNQVGICAFLCASKFASICTFVPANTSLAHQNEGNQNQVRIAEAGGIEAVVAAMATHQASARMQEWACRALKKLAEHGGGWDGGVTLWGGGGRVGASLRQRIKTAGGVERVRMAVKASIATHQTKTLGNAMLDIFAYEDAKYAATGTRV